MKENSIEEDIKILEKNVESVKENSDMAFFETDEDYYFLKAIGHILSDYKRVLGMNEILLKENEELKTKYDKDTHKLQNDLDIANAKNIEKDKIIDLMASEILKLDIKRANNTYDKARIWETEKGIKQYFENKAKEE